MKKLINQTVGANSFAHNQHHNVRMNSHLRPAFRTTSLILALAGIGLATLPTTDAYANPTGGQVVAGNVAIRQETATKVGITQTTDKAIIDWQKYSIGANEHVQYYQPSASSVALNRVVGQDPSQILGRLTANGQVFLVNPNGIYFGKNAQIDVAGLVASTHNIRNEDFLAGKYNFNIPGKPGAAIINEGAIRIADTGIAAFVAPSVANRGVIAAKLGKIALAAANGFTLDFTGDQLLTFLVGEEVAKTAFDLEGKPLTSFVENSGRIEAQGGYVLLTAKAAENAIHGVINQSGNIEATTVGTHNGEIILNAGKGSLEVSGTLDASAPNGGDGGFIETSGGHVTIDPATKITTRAPYGKDGKWLIDPTNYLIASSGGDITGTALATYLASTNVEIQTAATGIEDGDILVYDRVTWGSANKLTLTAYRHININAAIDAAGGGSIKLRADSTGTGAGTLIFGNGGSLAANGGSVGIYYNPHSYTDATTKSDANGNPYSGNVLLNGGATLTAYMLVNDVNQLQAMNTNLSGRYALGKGIDASATSGWNGGAGFEPIGNATSFFLGVFDGQHNVITSLVINRQNYSALFGVMEMGVISNVGMVGGSAIGWNGVGGLAGYIARSTITNCYNTGNVSGYDQVGGLVGISDYYSMVSNSYATGKVDIVAHGYFVGGLIGQSQGSVSNSYAAGSVTGINYVGGLVGGDAIGSVISNSYATGSVTGIFGVGGLLGLNTGYTTVSNSYWDIQSGHLTSAGGTGKNTAQMKQPASFAGWDFTNTWQINEGVSYPTLRSPASSSGTTTTLTPIVVNNDSAQRLYNTYRNADLPALLAAIIVRDFKNDPTDPVWRALYQNGAATAIQREANTLWNTYDQSSNATLAKSYLEGGFSGNYVPVWNALIAHKTGLSAAVNAARESGCVQANNCPKTPPPDGSTGGGGTPGPVVIVGVDDFLKKLSQDPTFSSEKIEFDGARFKFGTIQVNGGDFVVEYVRRQISDAISQVTNPNPISIGKTALSAFVPELGIVFSAQENAEKAATLAKAAGNFLERHLDLEAVSSVVNGFSNPLLKSVYAESGRDASGNYVSFAGAPEVYESAVQNGLMTVRHVDGFNRYYITDRGAISYYVSEVPPKREGCLGFCGDYSYAGVNQDQSLMNRIIAVFP